jgi:hypothetical protein
MNKEILTTKITKKNSKTRKGYFVSFVFFFVIFVVNCHVCIGTIPARWK